MSLFTDSGAKKEQSSVPQHVWQIDRRISVTLIFAIMLQAFAVVVWAVRLDLRVEIVEKWISDNYTIVERLQRLDQSVSYMKLQLDRIEAYLFGNSS